MYVCVKDSRNQNHLLGNISQVLGKKNCLCIENNNMIVIISAFLADEIIVVTQLAHSDKERQTMFFFLYGAELMCLQGKSS